MKKFATILRMRVSSSVRTHLHVERDAEKSTCGDDGHRNGVCAAHAARGDRAAQPRGGRARRNQGAGLTAMNANTDADSAEGWVLDVHPSALRAWKAYSL